MGISSNTSSKGLVSCNRYAYPPNSLHYCGPDKPLENVSEHLQKFETLYPYLVLIAQSNNIRDPFDPRVVEAYWLGNNLLSRVKTRAFGDHIADTLSLKKKLTPAKFHGLMDHVLDGVPQHTFHVLNIFLRTGHVGVAHTLETMDECRISWGRVQSIANGELQMANRKTGQYIVESRSLIYEHDKIQLGNPIIKTVESVEVRPKEGEWVSVHWGVICEVLTDEKRRNLALYTKRAIEHANRDNSIS